MMKFHCWENFQWLDCSQKNKQTQRYQYYINLSLYNTCLARAQKPKLNLFTEN